MLKLLLNEWCIAFAPPEQTEPPATGSGAWIVAQAPGDIYTALHESGVIPHPFYDSNELVCSWVKDKAWWWRTKFPALSCMPDERVDLVFDGLDTFAEISLNGEIVGRTNNMFRQYRFDIGSFLHGDGESELLIRFDPTARALAGKSMPVWPIIADRINESKRNFARKAQFGWGWDMAPRLPTVGIWRAAYLERGCIAKIQNVYVHTLEIGATCRIGVSIELDQWAQADLRLSLTVRAPNGDRVATRELQGSGTVEVSLNDPPLWWIPELGDPALHTLELRLCAGERVIDARDVRFGIRTIELDRSVDEAEPGCEFFRFVLNGVSVFARGANWVPASSFVGAITDDRYRSLVHSALDANMNMLRVWGGGVYEADAFYDACDQLGILVWQDFMFACAPYPEDDPVFVENVRVEVEYQIRRLRGRACLALWCGNNEGDAVQAFVNRLSGTQTPFSGNLYIHSIIPDAVAALDPATPYWPGSPGGGPSHNSMRAGDVHNWTVWHGLPPTPDKLPVGDFDLSPTGVAYTRYAEDMCRFVSEFGILSAPSMQTLQRWMSRDLEIGSAALLHRIRDEPAKVDAMLVPVTGLARTIEEYVRFTQVVQAEGLKFGIEHYRRRKPHCSGALIWQLNDCWPGMSWSLVDFDGVAKPAWYAVRRAFSPVLGSLTCTPDGAVEVWVTNDTGAGVDFVATITLATLGGAVVWSMPIAGSAPPHSSRCVYRCSLEPKADNVITLRSPQFPDNRMFFAPLKDLRLESAALQYSVTPHGDGLHVRLRALRYCLGVHLVTPDPRARFDDNFFDLMPDEERLITVTGATEVNVIEGLRS